MFSLYGELENKGAQWSTQATHTGTALWTLQILQQTSQKMVWTNSGLSLERLPVRIQPQSSSHPLYSPVETLAYVSFGTFDSEV